MIMTPPDGGLWPGFETWLWGTEQNPVLHIHERVHANGNEEGRDIELGAIAVWRELLGYESSLEALEAILYVDDYRPSQEDPETGVNVWAEPYMLLQFREEAREDAAEAAVREGRSRAEVLERSEQAAYEAVHVPIGDGECAMDRSRREARRKLGCAEPSQKCGVKTRTETPSLPEKPSRLERVFSPAQSRRAMLLEALEGLEPLIAEQSRRFLHALSGHERDVITPPPLTPEERLPTAQDIMVKYQEAGMGERVVS